MKPTPPPRISIHFAAQARLAVILRRGPSEWVHLLTWDTRTDRIEGGSWFHGRIYEERCDVSPDGKLFAYFAAKHGSSPEPGYTTSWVGVSRPPWITALALWPKPHGDTWGGDCYFADNDHLVVSWNSWDDFEPHPKHPPKHLKTTRYSEDQDESKTTLPERPYKFAQFDGERGQDQRGQPFWLSDGRLWRGTPDHPKEIADFTTKQPKPVPSPKWAQSW